MTDHKKTDLEKTEELFAFLQGVVPEGYEIGDERVPHLTPDQAWTVVWYLGNLYWRVTDKIERCSVCGDLFNSESDGTCNYGEAPYHFCGSCENGPEAEAKRRTKPEGLKL